MSVAPAGKGTAAGAQAAAQHAQHASLFKIPSRDKSTPPSRGSFSSSTKQQHSAVPQSKGKATGGQHGVHAAAPAAAPASASAADAEKKPQAAKMPPMPSLSQQKVVQASIQLGTDW